MKKKAIIICALIAAVWHYAEISTAAENKNSAAPQNEIVITGEKKSARFSHAVHLNLGVECGQCHHDSNHEPLTAADIAAVEKAQQLSCKGCHNPDFSNPELQSLKDVFHARCRECHKQGVGGKTGPSKCTDCHVK